MFFTIRRKRLNINLFDELYDRLIEMKYPAYENDRLILEMVDIYISPSEIGDDDGNIVIHYKLSLTKPI